MSSPCKFDEFLPWSFLNLYSFSYRSETYQKIREVSSSLKLMIFIIFLIVMYNEKDRKIQVVMRINLGGLLTRSDYENIYNILFARRLENEPVNIRNCVNRLAIGTRTKMTLKEDEDQDSILVFWRYYTYLTTIPT